MTLSNAPVIAFACSTGIMLVEELFVIRVIFVSKRRIRLPFNRAVSVTRKGKYSFPATSTITSMS